MTLLSGHIFKGGNWWLVACFQLLSFFVQAQGDPLPSWNNSAVKESIIRFVSAVTNGQSSGYVPPEDRIATFDNDGTLWAEKPVIQELFVVFRINQLVAKTPALRNKQPYKAVLEKNRAYLKAMGRNGLLDLMNITHTGMTETDFREAVRLFFDNARHPVLGVPIAQLVYQPQLELLEYLKNNQFKIYICSGGTVEFIRAISWKYYGIPPEQVIGSTFHYAYVDSARVNDIMLLKGLYQLNDQKEKPVNIQYFIGKRPILACGNIGGGGDISMLRFCQGSQYPSLQLLVHHDDDEREFAYEEDDNESLNNAHRYGWGVISMKNDWQHIFVDAVP
ncbi:HAD family hydrolase [Chitinophaga qingshengii]|uniref:Haloacid dehalogenase-like hydrolase n=1 Tax=Chitinophaga qingshengii TaxID=1569794 RepID=A0ABR7THP7_9BACT|nr:HAD family hydrolase [Chitinophaga qingshengii]MBC9929478.1 haloacid dehalogenase-like hydrolase [Chitinophaga qingshengii]